jgi:acetyl esterase/lipase
MNSLASHVVRFSLRAARPVLYSIRHPAHTAPVDWALARAAVLPGRTRQQPIRLGQVPGLEIRNLAPRARADRTLLYVHGGGFAFGSPDTHRALAARLMQAGGFARVLLPRYRLAPAHCFPAAHDDTFAFWRAAVERYGQGEICLAGESAGANLAVGICLQARAAGVPQPARVYLHSPWLDVGFSGDAYHDPRFDDAFLGRGGSFWLERVFGRHYAGATAREHPLLSPVHADLAGLPPFYVHTGEREVFTADTQRFSARCHAGRTACAVEIWPGMWHAFLLLAPFVPEANHAIRRAGRWLGGDASLH